ncbi:hypothetical protein [Sphingomonas qomolangmaensis]|uniref:Uncharacterized protein n=1 Tax=Sphingomonas qomolangmaensis TaxID=2918765 RepID=A0ABY5L7Q0_9SPHN|nr:hypothetical protein [Sphingomonas qomolangmaensis]UUL82176.1 hypothetical protein NMP03_13435 [Sphingomonas qomolangmaensis]
MADSTPRASLAFLAPVVLVTLAALWFVSSFTASMVLASGSPAAALAWWPTDSARNGVAGRLVLNEPSPSDAAAAVALSNEVLERSPVSAAAARNLALATLLQGDLGAARRIIALGEGLSRRDVPTQMWLIEDRVQAGDIPGALVHYHRAMQTSRDTRETLLPVLAQAASDPVIARSLAATFVRRPEWWSDFLGRFVATTDSPESLMLIARGLRLDPRSDIDRARLVTIYQRAAILGDAAGARGLFLQVTGQRSQALLVNDGGFEQGRGMPPFDWALADESDRAGVRETRPGATGAVALTLTGNQGKEVARQLLALAPGRYRLTARVGAVGPGLLSPPTVSVACASGDQGLVESSRFPPATAPTPMAMDFAIDRACRGQWLIISSAANVGFLSDEPWIDDIRVVPATR